MARIRSLHPGIFTDEAYASLPMAARVLLTGIWTECDDHGVFEWKPLGLKMKVFPADPFTGDDMHSMLGALEGNECIKRFDLDGKPYGAVRNFCRWQRPKNPTYRYPVPPEIGTYTAVGGNQFPTDTEKSSLMEDGGGSKEEGKNSINTESFERAPPASSKPPPAAPVALSPKTNPGFGSALPEDWTPSDELCDWLVSAFKMTDDDIRSELIAFHAHNASQGVLSKNWDATFRLFCKRWREHRDKQAPPRVNLTKTPPAPTKQPEQFTEADWARVAGFYAKTGRWERGAGPDPYSPACLCPKDILQAAGIDPSTGQRTIPPKKAVSA